MLMGRRYVEAPPTYTIASHATVRRWKHDRHEALLELRRCGFCSAIDVKSRWALQGNPEA